MLSTTRGAGRPLVTFKITSDLTPLRQAGLDPITGCTTALQSYTPQKVYIHEPRLASARLAGTETVGSRSPPLLRGLRGVTSPPRFIHTENVRLRRGRLPPDPGVDVNHAPPPAAR